MATRRIELGDEARDTITGFQGVVISEHKWLHGCRRLGLQPKELKDGKPIESVSFDEPQLELVVREFAATTSKTGGDRPEVARSAVPGPRG